MGSPGPAATLTCHSCGGASIDTAKFCAQCGEPLLDSPNRSNAETIARGQAPPKPVQPFADPLIGMVVAERYRIVEQLGRGGMGVVYKAEHVRIGKLMALKLLTGNLTRDSDQVKRFRREAQMASHLSHPNTVQVFDFGGGDGLTYLAMEYLRGIDLARVIEQEGPLSPVRTARLMIQICSSLIEAHEKDIVHRDLKPENIMVVQSPTGGDMVKVLDFGLAKLRESRELAAVTMAGAIVGTPYYMSPEQVQGENVDQRSDVYSMGALMHMCLTCEPVFDAPNPMGVLAKQLTELPLPVTERFPELQIPPIFSHLVLRCLAKDPNERFRTARELQAALVTSLHGLGQTGAEELLDDEHLRNLADTHEDAATRGEIERYERKLQRRGRIAYALVGLVLIGGGLVGFRAWEWLQRAPEFRGEETEPNNKASEANTVPFGKRVRGTLGKRLDKARSDRDFYHFDVPAGDGDKPVVLALEVSPLGNMELCAWLYRVGGTSPLARYCPGAVDAPLSVPQLELLPGGYLIAVMQDRTEYQKGRAPPVYENVSDWYTLKFEKATRHAEQEMEPNGQPSSAEQLEVGDVKRAQLGFARDEDVFCAKTDAGSVVFEVADGIQGVRHYAAVLQVTPMGGPADEVPVRVHPSAAKVSVTERDQLSPWTSPAVTPAANTPACLHVTLVPNPWAPTPHPLVAPPSYAQYSVTLRPAPVEGSGEKEQVAAPQP